MPKKSTINLIGHHFDEWEVIGKDPNKNTRWICKCTCGTVRSVEQKTLLRGTSKSCGHKTNAKRQFYKGQKFDQLEIINPEVIDKRVLCRCSCGKEVWKETRMLKDGETVSCGHTAIEKLKERNSKGREKLEGRHFGEWEVLKYVGDKHYSCRCSCGKIKNVASRDLKQGISKSCGHNNGKKNIKYDIQNKRFDYLVALKPIGGKKWICKCDCGNTTIVARGNLLTGSVHSCGCKQYDRLSKEQVEQAIETYSLQNGELPYYEDLSKILDRHIAHIREYVERYDLKDKINRTFKSRQERELYGLFGGIPHIRSVLDNSKEIDLYIPKNRIAIEFNGSYWHSDLFKNETYHQEKTIECAKKGIRLIHIFEYEWNDEDKKRKIISLINSAIDKNKPTVIYGRDTEVFEIETYKAKEFLNEYHLQGYAQSSVKIGIYNNKELIGVMTFGKPRFNSNYQWELIRLAWKENIRVIGGLEKMFNFFVKRYNPESIITYCDISKFTGNSYTKLGFKADKESITKPNYMWVDNRNKITFTRYQAQKQELIKLGLGTEEQTEEEIMKSHGYTRVYDCGNLKLSWYKENNLKKEEV